MVTSCPNGPSKQDPNMEGFAQVQKVNGTNIREKIENELL